VAKPIELGLYLEGEDAIEFNRYLSSPDETEDGRRMIGRAVHISRDLQFD
jgi:hypothetical protein